MHTPPSALERWITGEQPPRPSVLTRVRTAIVNVIGVLLFLAFFVASFALDAFFDVAKLVFGFAAAHWLFS